MSLFITKSMTKWLRCAGWLSLSLVALPATLRAEIDVQHLMQQVDARAEGDTFSGAAVFRLTDRNGGERIQNVRLFRQYQGDDRRSLLFYDQPAKVRGTAFLTYDYASSQEDDQWIYLPALRKPRRISASDRGDYFLGTDLTYEDMKRPSKINLKDWQFTFAGEVNVQGRTLQKISALPASPFISKELGYGRALIQVDASNATLQRIDFWDLQDQPLKSVEMDDIRLVDGIWTAHHIHVTHHKSGHHTDIRFDSVAYNERQNDQMYQPNRLDRGP